VPAPPPLGTAEPRFCTAEGASSGFPMGAVACLLFRRFQNCYRRRLRRTPWVQPRAFHRRPGGRRASSSVRPKGLAAYSFGSQNLYLSAWDCRARVSVIQSEPRPRAPLVPLRACTAAPEAAETSSVRPQGLAAASRWALSRVLLILALPKLGMEGDCGATTWARPRALLRRPGGRRALSSVRPEGLAAY
jgi:hypothetical protein